MRGTLLVMTRGDTARFPFYVMDPPAGPGYAQTLTDATLYFSAKHSVSDVAPLFTKTNGAGGIQILAVGDASTPGEVLVVLAAADTNALADCGVVLVYDLVVVDSSGGHFTVSSGPLVVRADVETAH